MTQRIPCANASVDKTINPEQLTQIIEAILAGKYSWACFLLLRCAGYNPIHYIPYRTYKRLLKESREVDKSTRLETNNLNPDNQCSEPSSNGTPAPKHQSKITDLDYLDMANEEHSQLRGGNLVPWLESNSLKNEWVLPEEQRFSSCHW